MPNASQKAATTAKTTATKKAAPAKATAAKATTPAADKGPRVIKNGGAKGEAIVALLTKDPSLTRAQLAEKVGATTGRVGEVLRFMRDHGDKAQQDLVAKHVASQPARKTAVKATPTAPARGNSAKAAPTKKAATPRRATKATAPTPSTD